MSLRQTAADWCFLKPGIDRRAYYRRLRQLGYAGVEMAAAGDRGAARDAGLELVTHSAPGMDEGLNRREHHPRLLDGVRAAIAEARTERIANVIVFSGARRGVADEAGIDACVDGLIPLARDAERAGVTLLFEALNTHDHADYHAHRSSFMFTVVRRVASPALKALYDIYHLHRMGEDTLGDLRANLPLIGHIHIAGAPRRDFPGPTQEIDYPRVVAAIHAAGYRGCWGQEFLPTGDALDELARAKSSFDGYATQQRASSF